MKFSRLAGYFERIETLDDRLAMTYVLAEILSVAEPDEIDKVVYFLQGQLTPPFKGTEMGMSEVNLISAISFAADITLKETRELFAGHGDLGLVAKEKIDRPGNLSVNKVHSELLTIAETSGKGSQQRKLDLAASLLKACSAQEALYVARFINGRLRLGVGDASVLDALAHMEVSAALKLPFQEIPPQGMKKEQRLELFNRQVKNDDLLAEVDRSAGERSSPPGENKRAEEYYKKLLELRRQARDVIERAYNLCSDLGLIATVYKAEGMDGIRAFRIRVGYPVRMALCERVPTSGDIISKMGRAAVEAKYDGLRLQVHRDKKDHVEIFSRNLERMTHMFPEVVSAVKALPADSLIIEGEAVAHNESTGELLPFQVTIQRRRKHDVAGKAGDIPLRFFAFELLYQDGGDCTVLPYWQRRQRLVSLIASAKGQTVITPAVMFETDKPEDIDAHFAGFVETGLEGVVAKRLDSPYSAGARNFNWIKLKRSYRGELADSVDLCIVGYFRGKGSRARIGLGAVLAAVYEPSDGTFRTVSKIGTGFTEEELASFRATLDEIAVPRMHKNVHSLIEADVWVEPRHVITVTADEITRSPLHTAGKRSEAEQGYALRFPRFTRLRPDKGPADSTTVGELVSLAQSQKTQKLK